MQDQIKAIFGIIAHPKQTMRALPSDRIFLLAVLSPFYFAIARAFRPRSHEILLNIFGGNLQIILAITLLSIVMIPVGAWLVQQFLKLFNKRLTIKKLMNINGYAHVPRFAVALVGYAIIFMNPSMFVSEHPTPALIAIIVLGGAGLIYTFYLLVYGVVVSQNEDKFYD